MESGEVGWSEVDKYKSKGIIFFQQKKTLIFAANAAQAASILRRVLWNKDWSRTDGVLKELQRSKRAVVDKYLVVTPIISYKVQS